MNCRRMKKRPMPDKLRNAVLKDDDETAIKATHEMIPTFTTPEELNKKVLVNS